MRLEYLAHVLRGSETAQRTTMLATYVVGQQRFAVEVASPKDAAQIERLLRAVEVESRGNGEMPTLREIVVNVQAQE